jgi:hypothetical protein
MQLIQKTPEQAPAWVAEVGAPARQGDRLALSTTPVTFANAGFDVHLVQDCGVKALENPSMRDAVHSPELQAGTCDDDMKPPWLRTHLLGTLEAPTAALAGATETSTTNPSTNLKGLAAIAKLVPSPECGSTVLTTKESSVEIQPEPVNWDARMNIIRAPYALTSRDRPAAELLSPIARGQLLPTAGQGAPTPGCSIQGTTDKEFSLPSTLILKTSKAAMGLYWTLLQRADAEVVCV